MATCKFPGCDDEADGEMCPAHLSHALRRRPVEYGGLPKASTERSPVTGGMSSWDQWLEMYQSAKLCRAVLTVHELRNAYADGMQPDDAAIQNDRMFRESELPAKPPLGQRIA